MSLECSECEHDIRSGHARDCSRYTEKTPAEELADFLLARIADEAGPWEEAKRQVVMLHRGRHECPAPDGHTTYVAPGFIHAFDPTLKLLAVPYADHPHYREEWRP